MSNYKKIFFFLFLALMLSSCIGIKREIKLYPNGSGREKMTITLNKKEIFDLQTMISSMGSDTASNNEDITELNSLFEDTLYLAEIRESFRKLEIRDSMKLTSVKEILSNDSMKTIEIKYDFKDIGHLISDRATANIGNNEKENIKLSETNVKLVKTKGAREFIYLLGKKPDEDKPSLNDSLNMDSQGIMGMIFGNDTFELQVEVPGDIISTNADAVNGRVVKWNNKMTDLLKNMKTLKVKYIK